MADDLPALDVGLHLLESVLLFDARFGIESDAFCRVREDGIIELHPITGQPIHFCMDAREARVLVSRLLEAAADSEIIQKSK